ncbi:methyltransferase domain-containing protein [Mucilaginibacter sp.]|uniref:methyltransferase domain-containing protein n=1 Tax=Mucilaginibacter sp. TaxID=1882438 RepID=UPI003B0014CD
MPDFSKRATGPELMDDFSLASAEIDPLLSGLELVNRYLGGYNVVFSALKTVSPQQNFHISDWGCGGGDVLRSINQKFIAKNLVLTGIDATPVAVGFARRKNISPNIRFVLANVLSAETEKLQADVVLSTLFTHHFSDEDWVLLIKKMMICSGRAVIIDDLHRHWLPYFVVKILTKLTGSRLAQYDGPLSVLKGFKREELKTLLQKAGTTNYTIRWKWAFRWQIILYKT